jgi:urease accessory protein
MSALVRAAAVLAFALAAGPALAHPPVPGVGGFLGGLLHPMFVPAHTLAILAVGLLIGQQAAWSRAAPLAFIALLAVGLALLTFGIVPRLMNELLLVLTVACGALVALARPLPEAAGCGLAAATAFVLALDSPPEVVSVREANFMLIGTGFGGTLLLIAAVEVASRLRSDWQRIGARVIGSWVAAAAILVLALRLAS